jgi:glucose/arabinose dehydrogenase
LFGNKVAFLLAGSLLLIMLTACNRGETVITITPPVVTRAPTVVAEPTATVAPAATVEPATGVSPATPTSQPTALPTSTPEPTAVPPTPTPPAQPPASLSLQPIADGFVRPTNLTHAFDNRLFVTDQAGRIHIIHEGAMLAEPFLDITDRVNDRANEQGLLGLAFHPHYQQNGYFFVNYTNANGSTVIARYQVSADNPDRADRDNERILLTISQPYGNHNGGQIKFGPDGYLYIGMGDGGSAGDPLNHGQDMTTLLGAMLRLDIDQGNDEAAYAIPADNPFVAEDRVRNEIWAIGLRNPWRFSFDRLTGDLFIADVGQNLWEEINFQPADSPGGENYGWNILEASHCFRTANCDPEGLVMPIAEYTRDGGCSVTGGYVYRGSQWPALWGNYFFADYCTGHIWSLTPQSDGRWQQTLITRTNRIISSFGEDFYGELYVLDHANGVVLRLQP